MFGLRRSAREVLYDRFELAIRPGEIVAVVGPSGSGKSMLLRYVLARCGEAIALDVPALAEEARLAVECLDGDAGDLPERLAVLSRCGLAEAAVLVTAARSLSGGQQYRLALARAIWAARQREGPALLVADEFGSTLDLTTARMLARQMRKLTDAAGGAQKPLAILLSAPRPELLEALRPERVIHKPLNALPQWQERPARESDAACLADSSSLSDDPATWPIVAGRLADYRQLGQFHYLADRPACFKRIWTIRPPREAGLAGPEVAAVLVVSPPVRCCRGRNAATNRRYCGADRRAAMARLNADLECISRVIVHPMYRSCGLAVRLVRHAIAQAPTPYVEALAAMGAMHPLFELAGMQAFGPFDGFSQRYTYYLSARPEDEERGKPHHINNTRPSLHALPSCPGARSERHSGAICTLPGEATRRLGAPG